MIKWILDRWRLLTKKPICSICQQRININNKIKHPYCNHKFHRSCLAKWHRQSHTCPICRQPKKRRIFLSNRPQTFRVEGKVPILISPSQPFYLNQSTNRRSYRTNT